MFKGSWLDTAVCLIVSLLSTKKKWILAFLVAIASPWVMAKHLSAGSLVTFGVIVIIIFCLMPLFSKWK